MKISAAYVAGLFDGEGSVLARIRSNGRIAVEISIAQNDRTVLDMVAKRVGYGRVRTKLVGRKCYHEYRVYSTENITHFVNFIARYSVVKRPQLLLMRRLLKTPGQPQRHFLASEISRLKGAGLS